MRYVYVIRNLINEKVYVGQTKSPVSRKAQHFCGARKGNDKPLYRSIRKHGEENFVFEILEECEDEVINEREQHWVTHFDSFNPEKGYNLTLGGDGGKGHKLTDEMKKRISQRTREAMSKIDPGLRKQQKERQRIAASSLEVREKVAARTKTAMQRSDVQQAHQNANESRSQKLQGRTLSAEQRQKISDAHKLWWERRHADPASS